MVETRLKILGAAAEIFKQYGLKNVTMDDIARRAGISKKTLYQHFTNKPDVIAETVSWYQGATCSTCDAAMTESANAVEAMVRVMVLLDRMYRQMNPVTLHELQRFYPTVYEKFRASIVDQDVKAIRDNIERGVQEGYYREGLDADLLARYRIESSLLALQPNMMMDDTHSMQQVAHAISELFLYGLMTPKGEKLYQKYKDTYLQQATKL